MICPTDTQIENAYLMGWQYLGDGIFIRGDQMGWFTDHGFQQD